VADGTVFVGSNDGYLYAVDADSGAQRWRAETGGSIFSSPTVADGTVYVGSCDGNLYAIHASDDGALSRGSRALLGTLGHHDTRITTDPATVDVSGPGEATRSEPTQVYDPDPGPETGGSGSGAGPTTVYDPEGEDTTDGTVAGGPVSGGLETFCPDCGTDVPEGATYCPGCGSDLVRCPACEATLCAGPPFCPACGSRVDGGT
jgi:hypothetical protein